MKWKEGDRNDFQNMLMACIALNSLDEQLIREARCSTVSDQEKGPYESKKGEVVGAVVGD